MYLMNFSLLEFYAISCCAVQEINPCKYVYTYILDWGFDVNVKYVDFYR